MKRVFGACVALWAFSACAGPPDFNTYPSASLNSGAASQGSGTCSGTFNNPVCTTVTTGSGSTAVAPGLVIGGALDTLKKGLYDAGADILGFSTKGVVRGVIDANGKVVIGGAAAFPTVGAPLLGVQAAGASTIDAMRWSADANTPSLECYKSRGATIGAVGAVTAGDNACTITGRADDGTGGLIAVAQIQYQVGGAVSSGIIPGTLFLRTANASGAMTTAITLDPSQNAIFAGALYGATSHLLSSPTAPTISSGFGTSPSITVNNGTASFRVNVGTGGSAATGVVGLPAATTGWNCFATDITTTSAAVSQTKMTGSTTTSVTLANYTDLSASGPWAASDILAVNCVAN